MWHPKTWSVSFSTICTSSAPPQSTSATQRTCKFHKAAKNHDQLHNANFMWKLDILGVLIRLRSGVGGERVLANLVLDPRRLQLLLVLSDPCDLGMCVDDRWDRIVVDVSVAGLDDLDSGNGYAPSSGSPKHCIGMTHPPPLLCAQALARRCSLRRTLRLSRWC